MTDTKMPGPVVVVTGASKGLGQAMAVLFARRGFKVAGLARSAEGLAETAGLIEAGQFVPLAVDVAGLVDLAQRGGGDRLLRPRDRHAGP